MNRMIPPIFVALPLMAVMLAGCDLQPAGSSQANSPAERAPEGVYFLKVAAQGVLEGKAVEKRPGSLLNRIGENTYQSPEGVMLQLRPEHVTNDMAVVRLIEREERARMRRATPVPTPAEKQGWVNPLDKGAYNERYNRSRPYYYPTPAPSRY